MSVALRLVARYGREGRGGARLRDIVRTELLAHGWEEGGRLSISGPPVTLTQREAQALSMAIHELSTNAVKYGGGGGLVVFRATKVYDGVRSDVLDNAYVIVDFPSGARGMLDLCMFAEGSRFEQELAVRGLLEPVDSADEVDEAADRHPARLVQVVRQGGAGRPGRALVRHRFADAGLEAE